MPSDIQLVLGPFFHEEPQVMQDPFSPQGIPNNRLVQLIETQRAQLNCVSVDWPKSHCLLADIGEYLARSAMILSQLAAELADGQHITSYAKETVRKMKEKTDFSDLDDLDYFDSKHTSLRLADTISMASESRDKF